ADREFSSTGRPEVYRHVTRNRPRRRDAGIEQGYRWRLAQHRIIGTGITIDEGHRGVTDVARIRVVGRVEFASAWSEHGVADVKHVRAERDRDARSASRHTVVIEPAV